jgi:alpha-tubulin suppressor-like RCC1 family protein
MKCSYFCASPIATGKLATVLALVAALFALGPGASGATANDGGALSAGSQHTCTIVAGVAKCWGNGVYGQLGDGLSTGSGYRSNIPVAVQGLSAGVSAVTVGNGHSCAIDAGAVKCWGEGFLGQLGGGADNLIASLPTVVSGLGGGVTAISAGRAHTCAIVSGAAKCWGDGTDGQLGDGSFGYAYSPADVQGLSSGVTSISAGSSHTCAIVSGAAKCWGSGSFGALGDGQSGTSYKSSSPVDVQGLSSGVTAISAGTAHTCAIVSGAVKCWGSDDGGALSAAGLRDESTPISISGLSTGVTTISAGGDHSCVIVFGITRCWGSDIYGEVGSGGGYSPHTVPKVQGLGGAASVVSAGAAHTCALVTGAPRCWGHDGFGKLGRGTAVSLARRNVKFKRRGRAKVRGKYVKFKAVVRFAVPSDTKAATACRGSVWASTRVRWPGERARVESGSQGGGIAAAGSACKANVAFKLPKYLKGKKIRISISFMGNAAVAKFSKTVSYKAK